MVTCVCLFSPDLIWRSHRGYSSIEDTRKYLVLAQKLMVADWQFGS
ncbi:hypothetical protein [Microcoleus sp. BROC3]